MTFMLVVLLMYVPVNHSSKHHAYPYPNRYLDAAQQAQSPSELYLAYREALTKTTTLEALQPFLAASVVAKVSATPANERPKVLGTLKTLSNVNQVHVTAEADTPEGHVLIVDGVDAGGKPVRGTVDLVKEPTGWKIVKESWHGR